MSSSQDVFAKQDPETHVLQVRIERGPHNFFDFDTLSAVADALEAGAKNGARAAVLSSDGKNFCAGADFSGSTGSLRGDGTRHVYDVATRLFAQQIPIVAAVQGAAIGGGLGLALVADFRVASPESRFSANFSLLGFHHGFALSETLPWVIGNQRSAELLYTGQRLNGRQAFDIGLCDYLVSADMIEAKATDLAEEIAKSAPLAVQSIRHTMRAPLNRNIEAALARERSEQERLQQTEDFREGLKAVSERRVANFVGR
ncbi:MAG: enoyl-CoA hydratase/isomerase family protein [Acidimicrobiia bacterium]